MGRMKEYEINNLDYKEPLYDESYIDASLDYLYSTKIIDCPKKGKKSVAVRKKIRIIKNRESNRDSS